MKGTCPFAQSLPLGILSLVTATVAVTYVVTKRNQDTKYRRILFQQYEADKAKKEVVARERKVANEPVGEVTEEVQILKVFVWMCEDLKKRFSSANVENVMKNKPAPASDIRSPLLRGNEFSGTLDEDELVRTAGQPYNKLIDDKQVILSEIVRKPSMPPHTVGYMRAGPRKLLHFDPQSVNAAIVTCGGLCPGLNNVIREITKTLHQIYGIGGRVYGIQGGFRGFYDAGKHLQPIILTPEIVEGIHHEGGTVLGSSRGGFDLEKILKFLADKRISQLYVIGGDGTHRGAFRIHEGCMEQGLNVAVAGIPKTIDNDVDYIDHSFGFSSAVEAAQYAIRAAKTEAVCNLPNGIGIVKLMGRSAGFIAAHATMASSDVDLCLVPEVPIVLEGEKGCLPHLMRRVRQQGYAVIVCAEGGKQLLLFGGNGARQFKKHFSLFSFAKAGEELLGESSEKDASGNKILPKIGEFLKKTVESYFERHGQVATVKYIDPSYTVRSVAANAADSLYCMQLAQNAVHGAMAGFTGFSVGLCNNRMVWLPIPELVATSPRSMNPRGRTWERVLTLTRQPNTVPPLKPGEAEPYDSHAPMLR